MSLRARQALKMNPECVPKHRVSSCCYRKRPQDGSTFPAQLVTLATGALEKVLLLGCQIEGHVPKKSTEGLGSLAFLLTFNPPDTSQPLESRCLGGGIHGWPNFILGGKGCWGYYTVKLY